MRELKTPTDIEKALGNLMPVALSERAVEEIENSLDQLIGESDERMPVSFPCGLWKMISGIAAIAVAGFFVISAIPPDKAAVTAETSEDDFYSESSDFIVLNQTDRVEEVEDQGVFIDQRGSAVRRVRVRVIGERRMRDEQTGIVMKLTEPREETYIVPAMNF